MEGGGETGTETERDERKEAPIFQCAHSCRLSFLPQRLYRQLSPPKHRGAVLILPGAGRSVVHGETLGAVWLEAVSPCPRSGSLPAGYIGKLVLLLNGKAREILAKH